MKIYFAGSISAGRQDVPVYQEIIERLKKYGQVLTEFIGNTNLSNLGEGKISDKEIHDRDLDWLLASDLVVAEVSTPSLGVGYEIGRALENRKIIVCLYRKTEGKRLSAMIKGAPGIRLIEYKTGDDIDLLVSSVFSDFSE